MSLPCGCVAFGEWHRTDCVFVDHTVRDLHIPHRREGDFGQQTEGWLWYSHDDLTAVHLFALYVHLVDRRPGLDLLHHQVPMQ